MAIVSCGFRFLETQLLSQRAQWEEEISALKTKPHEAGDRGDTAGDAEIKVLHPPSPKFSLCCFIQSSLHALLNVHFCARVFLKDLAEQVAVRDQECSRLRRELKELKHTVTLRRILSYAGLCKSYYETFSRHKKRLVTLNACLMSVFFRSGHGRITGSISSPSEEPDAHRTAGVQEKR